jgi:hypothetical protein
VKEDMMKKEMVGVAAEFAVASELARHDIYAQPTFSRFKRTDLLVFSGEADSRPIRIGAKGKQSTQWPNCKGISDSHSILVLVDFEGKKERVRPDFYILTASDWLSFVKKEIRKRPGKGIKLDSDNCPVWTTQIKNGKPYRGMGVEVADVAEYKEAWGKIADALK